MNSLWIQLGPRRSSSHRLAGQWVQDARGLALLQGGGSVYLERGQHALEERLVRETGQFHEGDNRGRAIETAD